MTQSPPKDGRSTVPLSLALLVFNALGTSPRTTPAPRSSAPADALGPAVAPRSPVDAPRPVARAC